jgi:chromate transporter
MDAETEHATTPPAAEQRPALRPAPRSVADLFWSFTWLALQGFGGVLAIVQNELVERKKWLTREEFLEEWAVAQVMPGANVVNLSMMIGARHFGLRGAIAALAGMLTIPLLILLLVAIAYAQFASNPHVAAALRGMGAVAAGLIAASGLRLSGALASHPLGKVACYGLLVLTFVAVAILRVPLVYLLLGLGGIACVVTYLRLKP